MASTVGRTVSPAPARASARDCRRSRKTWRFGQAGQIVVQRVLQQPVDRVLLLGDVDDRADAADDLAVGAEHRPGADRQPVDTGRPRRGRGNRGSAGRGGVRAARRAWRGSGRGRPGCRRGSQLRAGPCMAPGDRPSCSEISGMVTTRSRATSQSQTVSPEPVSASDWRSRSENRPCW